MIDENRLERILDQLEDVAGQVACMTCGSTITQEHFDQLEDALQLIRNSYIANVEHKDG